MDKTRNVFFFSEGMSDCMQLGFQLRIWKVVRKEAAKTVWAHFQHCTLKLAFCCQSIDGGKLTEQCKQLLMEGSFTKLCPAQLVMLLMDNPYCCYAVRWSLALSDNCCILWQMSSWCSQFIACFTCGTQWYMHYNARSASDLAITDWTTQRTCTIIYSTCSLWDWLDAQPVILDCADFLR